MRNQFQFLYCLWDIVEGLSFENKPGWVVNTVRLWFDYRQAMSLFFICSGYEIAKVFICQTGLLEITNALLTLEHSVWRDINDEHHFKHDQTLAQYYALNKKTSLENFSTKWRKIMKDCSFFGVIECPSNLTVKFIHGHFDARKSLICLHCSECSSEGQKILRP